MYTVNLAERELLQGWSESDPTSRTHVDFPVFSATGAKSTAVVYFEVSPGEHCGRHTDSAEEVVYVVEGSAEVSVGDETATLEAGSLAVIPALVGHDVRNVGDEPLKVLGFFPSNVIRTVFDEPLQPFGRREVGTYLLEDMAPVRGS